MKKFFALLLVGLLSFTAGYAHANDDNVPEKTQKVNLEAVLPSFPTSIVLDFICFEYCPIVPYGMLYRSDAQFMRKSSLVTLSGFPESVDRPPSL